MSDDAEVENELLKIVRNAESGRVQFGVRLKPSSEFEKAQIDQQNACLERLVKRQLLNKLTWSDNPAVVHVITEAGRSYLALRASANQV